MIYKHGMNVVENDTIPFGNYKCMTIYKWIFTKWPKRLTQVDFNHEATHLHQQTELLVIFFYLWYVFEWLIKFIVTALRSIFGKDKWDWKRAYRSISFEMEAYENEENTSWTNQRPEYYWLRFVFKLK